MKLNPKINIPGRFGEIVEKVFDYFPFVGAERRLNESDSEYITKTNLKLLSSTLGFMFGILGGFGHALYLEEYFTDLSKPTYPTQQEIRKIAGERAVRQFKREQTQASYEERKRKYDEEIGQLERGFEKIFSNDDEMKIKLEKFDAKVKEYNQAMQDLPEVMRELRGEK